MAVARGVDLPEGGCGEGGEQQRMGGHRLGHGLPAGHPGPDQMEHVRRVQPGAGAQGVQPRVVMEVLGHSQLGITMNLYSHVMPSALREAADAIDRALGGPSTGSGNGLG
jgi:integrase